MTDFHSLVPFLHVRDVAASTGFYRTLGFEVANTFTMDGASEPTWAWLRSGGAHLMIARATAPIVADQQAVMFYLYVEDVPAKHAELRAAGIEAHDITYAFYAPRGEFRVVDPDGYGLMITHARSRRPHGNPFGRTVAFDRWLPLLVAVAGRNAGRRRRP